MTTIKDRIIAGIGDQTIDRPRELQIKAETSEHHITHVLYSLQKDGYIEFKTRRDKFSPGINLTRIRLTKKGKERLSDGDPA